MASDNYILSTYYTDSPFAALKTTMLKVYNLNLNMVSDPIHYYLYVLPGCRTESLFKFSNNPPSINKYEVTEAAITLLKDYVRFRLVFQPKIYINPIVELTRRYVTFKLDDYGKLWFLHNKELKSLL